MEQALRYNKGKTEWSLMDLDALEPMIRVLMFGRDKYARDDWKKGLPVSNIIDSLMRHLQDLQKGETIDTESKLPIVGHILCNAMFLSYVVQFKPEFNGYLKEPDTKVEEARRILKDAGFFVDNLWSESDVESILSSQKLSSERKQQILNKALTNSETMEQIWLALAIAAEEE